VQNRGPRTADAISTKRPTAPRQPKNISNITVIPPKSLSNRPLCLTGRI